MTKTQPCNGWNGPDGTHIECQTGATVGVFEATIAGAQFVIASMCHECAALSDAAEKQHWQARRLEQARDALRLPASMRGWSLDTFPQDSKESKLALNVARGWLDRYFDGQQTSLFLWGDVGGGKTGLAVSLALEVARRSAETAPLPGDDKFRHEWEPPVGFVVFAELLARIREGFNDPSRRGESTSAYFRKKVLVVDDLGRERPTDFAREELADLVDVRHRSGLVNIVTSNYSPGALAERLGHDDPVIGKRIVSRLLDGAVVDEIMRPRDMRLS